MRLNAVGLGIVERWGRGGGGEAGRGGKEAKEPYVKIREASRVLTNSLIDF